MDGRGVSVYVSGVCVRSCGCVWSDVCWGLGEKRKNTSVYCLQQDRKSGLSFVLEMYD